MSNVWGHLVPLLIWPRRLEGQIQEAVLRAHPLFGPVLTLAAMGLLVVGVLWIYQRTTGDLSARRRGLILAMRLAGLACLLPVLVELSVQLRLRSEVRPAMAVLVDTSQSMSLADPYVSVDARSELAAATGETPAQDMVRVTRLDLIRRMLGADAGRRLERLQQRCELYWYAFDSAARPLDSARGSAVLDELQAEGESTSLVNALDTAIERLRGRPAVGVLLFSDGASNAGGSPLAAVERWRQAGVAIHSVVVGDPDPKDIELRQVLADDLLFSNDPATILVRVAQRGYGGSRVPIVLRLGGEELARADAVFEAGTREQNVSLTFTPTRPGEFTFRVESPPLPDEAVQENNYKDFAARVTTDKLRVLLLEGRPRWQFRFLRDAMVRDHRLNPQVFLAGAEQASEPRPPMISSLPRDREAFEQFDVFIIGDLDPANLTSDQMQWIRDAVRDRAVGVVLLSGPAFNPRAYVDTPLGDLVPIEPGVDPARGAMRPQAGDSDRFLPQLTPLGRTHPAIQLADEVAENLDRWRLLPEVYWYVPAAKTRAGASVLVIHPSETTGALPPEPVPLMAMQQFGKGRVFYCGMDETWRWRLKQGDRIFYRLWGQIIQYLGAPHLSGGQQGLAVRTDKPVYGRGETALITVQTQDVSPGEALTVMVQTAAGELTRLPLTPSPGAERLLEARIVLASEGFHKLWVEGHEMDATTVVEVSSPRLEFQEPAANVELMRQIAAQTAGRSTRPGEIDGLLNSLDLSPREVLEQRELTLWDSPLAVLVFVALLGIEWVLRRLWQLP